MENEPSSGSKEALDKLSSFALKFRYPILIILLGLILIGAGAFFVKNDINPSRDKIEVLESATEAQEGKIIVEVSGAVEKPGVYTFAATERIDDALVAAGGLSGDADRIWFEKTINRAAKLSDGQKIYIPRVDEQSKILSASNSIVDQSASSGFIAKTGDLVNINESSLSELDTLSGIGPVYAQKIIDHRPYSDIGELVSEKVLPQSTYEKIKDKISIY